MFKVPHPGKFILEEADARGWSKSDPSCALGITEDDVDLLVSGKTDISADMAQALGKSFGVSPEYFTNLQMAFDGGDNE